jgi:hypothetical protein
LKEKQVKDFNTGRKNRLKNLRLYLIIVNYSGASPCKERCIFVQLIFPCKCVCFGTFYDCENKRSGISNETDNLQLNLFQGSETASDANDMLINVRAVHMCTTRKLFMEFPLQKEGEISLDNRKHSGTPPLSI